VKIEKENGVIGEAQDAYPKSQTRSNFISLKISLFNRLRIMPKFLLTVVRALTIKVRD